MACTSIHLAACACCNISVFWSQNAEDLMVQIAENTVVQILNLGCSITNKNRYSDLLPTIKTTL